MEIVNFKQVWLLNRIKENIQSCRTVNFVTLRNALRRSRKVPSERIAYLTPVKIEEANTFFLMKGSMNIVKYSVTYIANEIIRNKENETPSNNNLSFVVKKAAPPIMVDLSQQPFLPPQAGADEHRTEVQKFFALRPPLLAMRMGNGSFPQQHLLPSSIPQPSVCGHKRVYAMQSSQSHSSSSRLISPGTVPTASSNFGLHGTDPSTCKRARATPQAESATGLADDATVIVIDDDEATVIVIDHDDDEEEEDTAASYLVEDAARVSGKGRRARQKKAPRPREEEEEELHWL